MRGGTILTCFSLDRALLYFRPSSLDGPNWACFALLFSVQRQKNGCKIFLHFATSNSGPPVPQRRQKPPKLALNLAK